MLKDLIHFYDQKANTYYFDLSFEETVIRHHSSAKKMTSGKILYVLGGIRMIILGGCRNAADGRDVTG